MSSSRCMSSSMSNQVLIVDSTIHVWNEVRKIVCVLQVLDIQPSVNNRTEYVLRV